MDSMDGKTLDGRELRVAMARYSRPNDSYRDYGGGRYNQRAPPSRRRRRLVVWSNVINNFNTKFPQ